MSKQGMKRPESSGGKERGSAPPVPEIQGRAKHGKTPAAPIIAGTDSPSMKVYHAVPHRQASVSDIYPPIDGGLAGRGAENDIPMPELPN